MKLQRITYARNGVGHQEFAGSQDAASKRCTELKKDKELDDKPQRGDVDIPTDKAGLIEWLNKNAGAA